MSKIRIIDCWREDFLTTTTDDTINQYVRMRSLTKDWRLLRAAYDWGASSDFSILVQRRKLSMVRADKEVDAGVDTLNLLFKTGALKIFEGCTEREKLIREIQEVKKGLTTRFQRGRNKQDDLVSALRYAVFGLSWNFEKIREMRAEETNFNWDHLKRLEERPEWQLRREERHKLAREEKEHYDEVKDIQEEFDSWN